MHGDLLLGSELAEQSGSGDSGRVRRCERAADLVRCFQEHSSYDGSRFQAWIWRKNEVRRGEVAARRLMP